MPGPPYIKNFAFAGYPKLFFKYKSVVAGILCYCRKSSFHGSVSVAR